MKQYIRTKDGAIYDTKELIKKFKKAETMKEMSEEEYTLAHKIYNNDFDNFGWKRRFDKESDNLEELCDNFMVEYKNGEHMIFHDFYHLKRHYELYSQEYHHISGRYGCMWVFGKGLIYVAKMNDKGELELI